MKEQKEKTPKNQFFEKLTNVMFWLPRKIWDLFKSVYFSCGFYLKHQLHIREFMVIDFRVVISLLLIVGMLFFLLYNRPLLLSMPDLETQIYVAENTLRTVSIFVGIVFSFIVLSFNIFYKYFGRLTFIKFFTGRPIKFIFTLFVSDLILLIYTCTYFKMNSARDSYGDGLFILSLLTSLLLVLLIIPTLVVLLRSSQDRGNIAELVNNFNEDWSLSYHYNVLWDNGNRNKYYQRDPITLLTEIGTAAIKDFDKTTVTQIASSCLDHFRKLHTEYKTKKTIHPNVFYHKVDDLIRSLYNVAVKERNETAAISILQLCYDIEEFYVENFEDFNENQNDEHHYDGIRFTVVMNQFLAKALQFNEDTLSERIIDMTRRWWNDVAIKKYLVSINYDYPLQERIVTDKPSFFISYTYSSVIKLFDLVFDYKKMFLYNEISSFYSTTNLSIIDSKNTRNTKIQLLHLNGYYSLETFKKFVPKLEGKIEFGRYPFDLASSYAVDRVDSNISFIYEIRAFDFLFRNGLLNAYVINIVKATALHAMKELDTSETKKKVLKGIIEKFDYLRSLVGQIPTDHQKEVYILLYRYLKILQSVIPEYNLQKQFVDLIGNTIKKFEHVSTFKSDLDAKGYVIDDIFPGE